MAVNHYELAMIIDPEAPEGVEEVKGKIKSILESFGGELEKEEEWGRRRMAYPINKKLEGHYVFWYIKIDGLNIKPLTEKLRLLDPLMRYMFIKRDLKKEEKRRKEKEKYLYAMEMLKKAQEESASKEEAVAKESS